MTVITLTERTSSGCDQMGLTMFEWPTIGSTAQVPEEKEELAGLSWKQSCSLSICTVLHVRCCPFVVQRAKQCSHSLCRVLWGIYAS